MMISPFNPAAQSAGNAAVAIFRTNPAQTGLSGPAPLVLAVHPPDGATRVRSPVRITATFSQPMLAASINSSTFRVTVGGNAVVGAVVVDPSGRTAYFTPVRGLLGNQAYTVSLTTGVALATGRSLASAHTWSFTSARHADGTAVTRR